MATEDDVRRIALRLPSTTERPSYGLPGFRVQDRLFARIHEEPGVLVAFRISIQDRDSLIATAPEKFYTTPHYATHPSVLVRLPALDTAELAEVLEEAWVCRATLRLRRQRDRGG